MPFSYEWGENCWNKGCSNLGDKNDNCLCSRRNTYWIRHGNRAVTFDKVVTYYETAIQLNQMCIEIRGRLILLHPIGKKMKVVKKLESSGWSVWQFEWKLVAFNNLSSHNQKNMCAGTKAIWFGYPYVVWCFTTLVNIPKFLRGPLRQYVSGNQIHGEGQCNSNYIPWRNLETPRTIKLPPCQTLTGFKYGFPENVTGVVGWRPTKRFNQRKSFQKLL